VFQIITTQTRIIVIRLRAIFKLLAATLCLRVLCRVPLVKLLGWAYSNYACIWFISNLVRYQQTSTSKTALPRLITWDIRLIIAQQWLQRLKCKVIALNNFIQ